MGYRKTDIVKDILFWVGVVIFFSVIGYLMFDGITNQNTKSMKKIEQAIYNDIEGAYAEGQRDAQNGDIRLDLLKNCWIKSPWECGKVPLGKIKLCNEEK